MEKVTPCQVDGEWAVRTAEKGPRIEPGTTVLVQPRRGKAWVAKVTDYIKTDEAGRRYLRTVSDDPDAPENNAKSKSSGNNSANSDGAVTPLATLLKQRLKEHSSFAKFREAILKDLEG